MADTKRGRDKQADDEERRQRKRDLEEARDRADEPEPPRDDSEAVDDLDDALEDHEYPTTTDELVAAYGDREVRSRDGREPVGELLDADDDTYDSADEARARIRDRAGRD